LRKTNDHPPIAPAFACSSQHPVNLCAQAFDVDMQLILGAMLLGVHGKPNAPLLQPVQCDEGRIEALRRQDSGMNAVMRRSISFEKV
jgi:hypothetical protein